MSSVTPAISVQPLGEEKLNAMKLDERIVAIITSPAATPAGLFIENDPMMMSVWLLQVWLR